MHPSDDVVKVERDPAAPAVAIVTLHYPERRNAFGLAMRQALAERLEALLYATPDCRAIVLTGAGGAFCSGGDISEMKPRGILELRQRNRLPLQVFEMLAAGPKPVVAAVEGPAMGAGLALACACDFIVTARDARYCAAFIRVGLLPDTGLYWSLAQRVGAGRARQLMMTAREFSGEEAQAYGMVNEVVEPGAALQAACALARRFEALPPTALAHLRAALAGGCDTLEATIETEIALQPVLRRSPDHQEAVAAFMAKRPPNFAGL